jgi:hypothetical protein
MEHVLMSDVTAIDHKDLVGEEVAAAWCGQEPATMAVWRSKGIGPAYVKTGRLIRYWLPDLREYIARNRHVPTRAE